MSSRTDGRDLLEHLSRNFPELSSVPGGVFAVGGAVRDALVGKTPVDIDLASAGAGGVAQEFARRTAGTLVQLGQHRFTTWRVVVQGRAYDFNDIVGATIEQDLRRRDFTINAIAVEVTSGRFVEVPGASADLRNSILRMVQEENFRDDPLRVLKGVRMAVTFELTIEPETLSAMQRHALSVISVAPERIATELDLIFSAPHRLLGLRLLHEFELDVELFGFSFSPDTVAALAGLGDADLVSVYATGFLERGAEAVDAFAERWRWGERQRKETIATIQLIQNAGGDPPILIFDYGVTTARRAVRVLEAFGRDAGTLGAALNERGDEIAATQPLLSGDEIQRETGLGPGPEVGRIKRAVLEAQLRGEISTREEAIALVRKLT